MLRAAISTWLRPAPASLEPEEGRQAYHSDIRALRPDAWACDAPEARGREVEQALWLADVASADFARHADITLCAHLVTPVDEIIEVCRRQAQGCRERADELTATLPAPNPYGRPPLPWHRARSREATALHRKALGWETLRRTLLSNRWT